MKKLIVLFSAFFLISKLYSLEEPLAKSAEFNSNSVDSWDNNALDRNPKVPSSAPLVKYGVFKDLLEKYLHEHKKFLNNSAWLGEKIESGNPELKNGLKAEIDQPFALKLAIPSGGSAYFWGDLHGDVQALAVCLKILKDNEVINDSFQIIQPDTYFFFLGDMVDRGEHQIDMLSLILIFAMKNIGKVFLIRGNHEDLVYRNIYGFHNQLEALYKKENQNEIFSKNDPIYNTISLFYNLMPDVSFVGCNKNYFQCCHGGIEIRYNPKELLAQSETLQYQLIKKTNSNNELLKRLISDSDLIKKFNIDGSAHEFFFNNFKNSRNPFLKVDLGFLWGDFNNNSLNNYNTYYKPNRNLFAGKDFTHEVLKYYSSQAVHVRGIMRAHQHNSSLPGIFSPNNSGIYPIWNNSVITNLSTSQFTGVIAFNKITFFDQYSDWRLTNFSTKNKNDIEEREDLLESWRNNEFEKTIPQTNPELLTEIKNEIVKQSPNYEHIKKWFREIKEDPLNKNDISYKTAQQYIEPFNKFMDALRNFYQKNYALAEEDFKDLVYAPFVKFKARQYYARTVLKGEMQSDYDDALNFLHDTLYDKSTGKADSDIANELLEEFRNLMPEIAQMEEDIE
ncbi:MAG: metallophosphoesterase [Candidatus Babeliaceae bacterium]|nr:metallophosphoesterase [Candidatus Babeliaceae bacterium]